MSGTRNGIQEFHPLTGLRGVGAVWVVLFHTWNESPLKFIGAGYLGVDLFFILSGFIMTHVHGRDFEVFRWKAYGKFLTLRMVRIFPLHVAVLSCFALFVFSAPGFIEEYDAPSRWDVYSLAQTYFLVHNWFRYPPLWNHPSWSLSAEWLGYLAFPAITLVSARLDAPRHFFLAAIASIALMVISLRLSGDFLFDGTGMSGLIRMAGGFTAGCMTYRYLETGPKSHSGLVTLAACALITAGTCLEEWRFLAFFGFASLILGTVTEETWLSRVLCAKPAMFVGDISYSLYLCHWPLLQIRNWLVLQGRVSEQTGLISVLLVIGAVSVLSWKYIEVPARNWGRRLIQQRFG